MITPASLNSPRSIAVTTVMSLSTALLTILLRTAPGEMSKFTADEPTHLFTSSLFAKSCFRLFQFILSLRLIELISSDCSDRSPDADTFCLHVVIYIYFPHPFVLFLLEGSHDYHNLKLFLSPINYCQSNSLINPRATASSMSSRSDSHSLVECCTLVGNFPTNIRHVIICGTFAFSEYSLTDRNKSQFAAPAPNPSSY